jgi:signal transduction histidine kinase
LRFGRDEFLDFAQQLERFADILPVGVAISCTPDTSAVTVNRYFARLLGIEPGSNAWLTPNESSPLPPFRFRSAGKDIPPEELPQQLAARLKQAIASQELEICRSDGASYFVLGSAVPVLDPDDEVLGTVGIFQDVSEHVHQREGLELFGGLLAHEIKSPITTILGSSYLLLRRRHEMPESAIEEITQSLVGETKRLQELAENMFFLSQVEQRGTALTEELIVRDIVFEIAQEYQEKSPHREIETRFPPQKYMVRGRKSYLTQIIRNLLANAEKYTPSASPLEIVGWAENSSFLLSVRDRGPGLVQSDIPTIFDPFVRSRATEDKATGSGIGLTVCRKLVEALGGSIWCENRAGGGAAFTLSLPLAETNGASNRG